MVSAGAYYYFSGKEYVVRIPESQIEEALEKKLPLTKTYLFIIDVTLKNPRVDLENGSDRVAGGMDVVFNIKVNGNPKPFGGGIDLSGNVSYSPEGGEFYLLDPVIEHFSVQGIAEGIQPRVNKAIAKALSDYFNSNPIYTLKRSDIKQAAAYAVLKGVVVEGNDLVVILGI